MVKKIQNYLSLHQINKQCNLPQVRRTRGANIFSLCNQSPHPDSEVSWVS
jgi:hypothetical protein